MAGISGKSARIKTTAFTPSSSTNLAADLSTDGVTLQITNTSQRHWPKNSTSLKVYDHGTSTSVALNSTLYDVNPVGGQVIFHTARSTSNTYVIDTEWYTTTYLGNVRGWSLDVNSNMLETTAMSTSATDTAWRTYIPGLNDATMTIDRFWPSDTGPYFADRIILGDSTGNRLIVEAVVQDAGDHHFEAYARVSQDSISGSIDGLMEESVTLQIDDQVYWSTNDSTP